MTNAQTEARAIAAMLEAERAERAEARVKELEDLCNSLEAQAMGYAEDFKNAEAQLAEARKALEPFARVSSLFDHMNDDVGSVMVNIHLSDLRAARRAYKGGADHG